MTWGTDAIEGAAIIGVAPRRETTTRRRASIPPNPRPRGRPTEMSVLPPGWTAAGETAPMVTGRIERETPGRGDKRGSAKRRRYSAFSGPEPGRPYGP